MNDELYYRPSGGVPLMGTLITMVVGCLGGAVLSVIYALINHYNPFIYFTIIATGLFGAGCGVCTVFGLTLGKVRNRGTNALAGLFVGIFALYLSWVWYLFLISREAMGQGFFLFDTRAMFGFMQLLAETGIWEMFGVAPTGIALYLIWVLEALIVVVPSAFIAWAADTPFCEPCHRWTEEKECLVAFRLPEDLSQLQESLEAGDFAPLFELSMKNIEPACLNAKIHRCDGCDESTWLELEVAQLFVDDDGEMKSTKTPFLTYLHLPRVEAEALLALTPDNARIDNDEEEIPEESEGTPIVASPENQEGGETNREEIS
ncbi:MAG: hypothetical protein HUJ26_08025 [Planctomycetaceae bacterium]|nr:hypothetical protein [Planctomycetaceae bacterium]